MLRKLRIAVAAIFFTGTTLLFLDFTGLAHAWLGWMARVQLLPALLTLNFAVVAALLVLTLLFGRLYCSVICPLGIMQDIFGWAAGRKKKNRYSHSPEVRWLRYPAFIVFVAALLAGGGLVIHRLALLVAPYSAFGRIVQSIFAPVWALGNNALAALAERIDSYAFYAVDVWIRSGATLAIAIVTLAVVGFLAWRGGRTWCNTVCPVGTFLGFFSRFSLFRPVIDTKKCNGCKLCARNCKAACIDTENHRIDYSRCVVCMDCIDKCHQGAISYTWRRRKSNANNNTDTSRRSFLTGVGILAATVAAQAQEKSLHGGLATIEDKKIPKRQTRIVPAGAQSLRNFANHCTACQLCVAACKNHVLRPSSGIMTLMQPEMSYERGYCRPECTACADVCPAGAILKITAAEKSSTQIGHAVWVRENCIPLTDGQKCGNCERHCPTGAITMVHSDPKDNKSPKIPVINTERCIGCGACENLCPARPFAAIYVEGHENHRTV